MSLLASNGLRDKLFKDKRHVSEPTIEFLPYYSIRHIIESHPLPELMKVSKKEVHKCLTYMFSKYTKEQTKEQTNKYEHLKNECINKTCKNTSKTICAHRDGFYICTYCGCVQSQVYAEGLHLPISEEELKILENGGDNDIAQWALAENEYGDIWNKIVLNQHVEHWNIYAHLSKDELEEVKEISTWMEKRASNECRVASAFIFKFIKDHTQKINTENLLQLKYELPEVKKICAHCDEKMYSIFDIKRHACKKNIQRKQWSYVKNKKTRIKIV